MKSHKLQHHFGGWKPGLPDARDFKLELTPLMASATLPASVDLRKNMPAVYDQGQLGSCTANAAAAMYEYNMIVQRVAEVFTPSRLFIYYNERVIDHDVKEDNGSSLRTAAKALAKYGVCDETAWPYLIAKFAQRAPSVDYALAKAHRSVLYKSVDNTNLQLLKSCLAQNLPLMFGFTVYSSFESQAVADSGMVPMPVLSGTGREQVLGGHANVLAGYDDTKVMLDGSTGGFLSRNSWGEDWGLAGYEWFPYRYLTNASLASDFWQVSSITG